MEFTAEQIAEFLNGTIEGDKDVKINNVSKIEEGKPYTLSFLSNPKYKNHIYKTKASIVLIDKDLKLENPVQPTLIKVDNAYKSFASLLDLYEESKEKKTGIEEMSFIHDTAEINKNVYIGSFTYIGKNTRIGNNVRIYPNSFIGDNVQIEDNTLLYPNVNIYENSKIGKNCILHSGAVIGSDGFGFAPNTETATYKKIAQIGNVIIEDNVEIGANTTIDKATMGSTIIRKGTKLDNLIQVGHNVEIGANTVFAAQVGISGSTKIGENCMFGGQVGVIGHTEIANGTKIGGQSGLTSRVTKENQSLMGTPAVDIEIFKKIYIAYRKLPLFNEKIIELEKQVKKLLADKTK